MALTDAEKLAKIEKQEKRLADQKRKIKAKSSEALRKKETIAKILLGSALLNRLESKDEKAEELYQWCREALTEKDRNRLDIGMGKETKQQAKTAEPA